MKGQETVGNAEVAVQASSGLPHENDPGRADDGTPSRTQARLSLSWAGVV